MYRHPKYYEIAFSYRDIPAEVDFVETVIGRYSRIPVKTILEMASGNSPHMAELCKRGYAYVGLERSYVMIDYSREKIRVEQLAAKILKGDMIDFDLAAPVECAAVFLGSFYIASDDDLSKHLQSAAKVVTAGGLYILDAAVSYFPEDMKTQTWRESQSGIDIDVTYEPRWKDLDRRLMEATITLDIVDRGRTSQICHREIRRMYSLHEFRAGLHENGSWQYVESCSDFDIRSRPRPGGRNLTILRRS